MAQRVLLVSYYYAPQNAIGAVRPTKLAKYLTRLGYEVTVLCAKPFSKKRDPALSNDMVEIAEIRVVREHSLLRWWKERGETSATLPALTERPLLPEKTAGIEKPRAGESTAAPKPAASTPPAKNWRARLLDALYLWLTFTADAAFARACLRELHAMHSHYDVVISTYGPHSVHTIARKAKAAGIAERWIADFRDEVRVPFPWLNGYKRRFTLLVRKHADAITAVSQGFLEMMRLAAFGHVIPNGYDREDRETRDRVTLAQDVLNLVYCGHVYPETADVSPVFAAFHTLIAQGLCNPARLRFHYAGREGAAFRAAAARYGLADTVTDHGFVPRARSIGLQRAADALMAATWNSSKQTGRVTGKLMEYLMAERPIICCVNGDVPHSDARKIIEETRTGVVYEHANAAQDAPSLKAYLLALYTARLAGEPIQFKPDANALAGYDYQNIARMFARLIDNI